MAVDYCVMAGSREAGKVQINQEGLYYKIICHARLQGTIMYRLVAVTDQKRENIGILAPDHGGYSLNRKIPCSRLPGEIQEFLLLPSHEPVEGKFVPISPEEPFEYLEKLKDAYLQRQKDRLGVVIPK